MARTVIALTMLRCRRIGAHPVHTQVSFRILTKEMHTRTTKRSVFNYAGMELRKLSLEEPLVLLSIVQPLAPIATVLLVLRSSRHLGPQTLRPKLNNSTRSCCSKYAWPVQYILQPRRKDASMEQFGRSVPRNLLCVNASGKLQLLVPTLGSACLFIFGNFRPQLLKPLCNTRHANTPICASKSDCNANTCIRSQVAAAPATVQSACIAR